MDGERMKRGARDLLEKRRRRGRNVEAREDRWRVDKKSMRLLEGLIAVLVSSNRIGQDRRG